MTSSGIEWFVFDGNCLGGGRNYTVEEMVDDDVGGAHPVPTNDRWAITGYSDFSGALTIPSYVYGYVGVDVTGKEIWRDYSITTVGRKVPGSKPFEFLTSAVVSEGIGTIEGAFNGASGLVSVSLPSTLRKITNCAFCGCTSLRTIDIPEGVTEIGDSAFKGCTGIETIVLPSSLQVIGNSAFEGCTGLRNIVIPPSCKSIGSSAFLGCTALESLSLGNCEELGEYAFKDCKSLQSLVVPSSLTNIPASAFRNCVGLRSLVIEEGVETVSGTAFKGDVNFESIYVGSTVTNLNFSGYNGPDASKVVSATFCELHPPKYVAKAFLRNFTGVVYYPPTYADEWAKALDDAGISNHKAWTRIGETDPGSVAVEGVEVEYSWLSKYGLMKDASPDTAVKAKTGKKDYGGNDLYVWQDYVAGTNPTNPEDVFKSSITFAEGKPIITWSPELSASEAAKREYKIFGKVKIDDKDWVSVDGDTANFNFFKVSVGMKP